MSAGRGISRAVIGRWAMLAAKPLPPAVEQAARMHMLDAVGVGLAASALAQGEPYRNFADSRSAPTGVATLAGVRVMDAATAALVNGGLIHSLEYDDTHTASIIHGSAVLAAVALAAGEKTGADPARMLASYALGYEVLIRLGLAAPGAFQARGFQVTSVAGALVAALVAADLMGLTEQQRMAAMGIGLSQGSGVFEFLSNGSSVKSMHPGWAAHAGMIAAELAAAGMTGPETAIEGERGLFATFAGDLSAADRFGQSLADPDRWELPQTAFKFYPCCHYLHPFIEAAGLLAAEIEDTGAIAGITLRIAPGAAGIVCEPWAAKVAPADGHAARWSLPVVVAARLIEASVGHGTFASRASAPVLALAARSRWQPLEPNRFPQAFEAGIEIELDDGRRLHRSIGDVFGNASRPATADAVLDKFRANAGLALMPDAVSGISRFLLEPGAPDFSTFSDALIAERRPR